jgi:AraC-like DNA-binding protein
MATEPDADATRARFLGLLDRLIARPPAVVRLGGTRVCATRPGDAAVKIHEFARLKIIVDGSQRHAFSRMDERQDIVLRRGQAIFWAPSAWTIPCYDQPFAMVGIVLQSDTMRLIHEWPPKARGSRRPSWIGAFHHTASPLGGAGIHIAAALSERARRPPDAALDPQLFHALLRAAREHLAADSPAAALTQGQRSWHRALAHLHDHYAEPISRDSVARALGLHPNYLSALFTTHGGRSFHDTLEDLRLERARHVLLGSDLTVAAVARMCGYAAPSHFISTFRRRFGATPQRYRRS